MSLSRRAFTKEFNEGTVRRLELGASVAEVARACEVTPNVLYRRRREFRKYAAKAFPGEDHRRIDESRIAELERKVGVRPWKSVFCVDACIASKSSGGCRH